MVDLHVRHVYPPHHNPATIELAYECDCGGAFFEVTAHRSHDLPRPCEVSVKLVRSIRDGLLLHPHVVSWLEVELPEQIVVSLVYNIASPLVKFVYRVVRSFGYVEAVHDALVKLTRLVFESNVHFRRNQCLSAMHSIKWEMPVVE